MIFWIGMIQRFRLSFQTETYPVFVLIWWYYNLVQYWWGTPQQIQERNFLNLTENKLMIYLFQFKFSISRLMARDLSILMIAADGLRRLLFVQLSNSYFCWFGCKVCQKNVSDITTTLCKDEQSRIDLSWSFPLHPSTGWAGVVLGHRKDGWRTNAVGDIMRVILDQ